MSDGPVPREAGNAISRHRWDALRKLEFSCPTHPPGFVLRSTSRRTCDSVFGGGQRFTCGLVGGLLVEVIPQAIGMVLL